jgi:4-amino-4-deoxy-L-arabinose transferase-like glycosyltransferase
MSPASRDTLVDLAWIGGWFALLILAGYGLRDPWPADEPRFASVALDMWRSGDWLIPRSGGDLYQDKPPLHFWLMAIGYSLTGSLRFGFLLPSMLASLGTLVLVYDLARRLHGREAGRLAAVTLACCVHFVMTTRGAQIDATLIFFCTLALWALSRHLLQAAGWQYALLGGIAAGLGIIDKAVGFLAVVLLPIAWMLGRRFGSLEVPLRTWLWVMVGMLGVVACWLLPMLWHVATVGTADLVAYRDELLFQQTVQRYTQAWHHIRPWWYYLVEVIPVLWLPLSGLLFWLVPQWREDWRRGRVATWLPLIWSLVVVVFFSLSTGKRGVYVLPALPALAIAAAPHLAALYARRGVQRLSLALAALLVIPGVVISLSAFLGVERVLQAVAQSELRSLTAVHVFALAATAAWILASRWRAIVAWPAVVACLTVSWGLGIAPQINGERSASSFVAAMSAKVPPERELGLLAYKEQFLLYLDRDTVNFGHARWREGDAEAFDAARWLAGDARRLLLVPEHFIATCFAENPRVLAGESSDDEWWLVSGQPDPDCVARGDPSKIFRYPAAGSVLR